MEYCSPPYTRQRKRFLESVESEKKKKKPSSNVKVKKAKRIRRYYGSSSSSVKATTSTDKPKRGRRRISRWMNKEQKARYLEQVTESEGFEVEDFSDFTGYGIISPVEGNIQHDKEFLKYCRTALKHYNNNVNQDAKKLKFFRIVKANYLGGRYFQYFITFEAKDTAAAAADDDVDDQVKTLQARVFVDFVKTNPVEVEFCRLKPTPTPTP